MRITGPLLALLLLALLALLVSSTFARHTDSAPATRDRLFADASAAAALLLTQQPVPTSGVAWTANDPTLGTVVNYHITAVTSTSITVTAASGPDSMAATASHA